MKCSVSEPQQTAPSPYISADQRSYAAPVLHRGEPVGESYQVAKRLMLTALSTLFKVITPRGS